MSLLLKSGRRYKSATSRRFRVSPYDPSSRNPSSSSLLVASTSSISGRALHKRTAKIQNAYNDSLKGYTSTERQDIDAARDDIAGLDIGPEAIYSQTDHHAHDENADEEGWIDDDECFNPITVAVVGHAITPSSSQTWSERIAREQYAWSKEMPFLCDALLTYLHTGPPPALAELEHSAVQSYTVSCIHLTSREAITFYSSTSVTAAQLLVRHGYIPPTPSVPSVAIHIDVLRYCAALRRHASLISIQGITEAICEIHNTLYSRHLRTQLTAALDTYLALTRMIDARLAQSMCREDPDWRIGNACAACSYRLAGEPELDPSVMFTCDGNESLKRVANASLSDSRTFEHSYFLEDDYVDQFAHETKYGKSRRPPAIEDTRAERRLETNDRLTGEEAVNQPIDSPPESHPTEENETPCEQRWKNARADDEHGKKLVVFDETGVFAVSCRHGTVMLVEDMRRSGELSKYGLAAVDKLLQIFGRNVMFGYDIGCTFRTTALNSPLVGPLVRKLQTRFVVGSFHGYAHQRKCQVLNHPLYTQGAGLESFEQNEQLFSSTNTVARTTRHSSKFHRRQHLALRLGAWDFGRRCSLGSTLSSRYKRALHVLATLPGEIKRICPGKTDSDWCALFDQEKLYLQSLEAPSIKSMFNMQYLKALLVLAEKERHFADVYSMSIVHTQPAGANTYNKMTAAGNKLEAKRRAASEQLTAAQVVVAALEDTHSIHTRWVPGSVEWEAAVQRAAQNEYYEKLRELECLVVQRVAELEKAHLIGTGYHVRMQIQKAVNQRARAISHALDRYNKAALALDPPRPTLTFNELTNCAYLAEFDFLMYSEHGALDAEWARPMHRQCTTSWHKIQRAREEIARLNIEIRRVCTHIRDEEIFLTKRYQALLISDPDLAHVLSKQIHISCQANRRIMHDLRSLSKTQGFSGDLNCGVKLDDPPETQAEPEIAAQPDSNLDSIADSLTGLALDSTTPDVQEEDDEPSDETLKALTGVEECCTYQ